MRLAPLIVAAALGGACTPAPIVGAELWRAPPEIRIAVFSTPDGVQVEALDGQQPLRTQIDPAEGGELWLLSYRADTLRTAFPGLRDASVAEILVRLAPQLGATAGEPPPEADEILVARAGDAVPNPLEYQARTWSEWQTRAASGLDFRFQLAVTDVCGEARSRTIPAPAALSIDGVVAIGGERAIVLGTLRDRSRNNVQLYLLEVDGTMRDLGERTQPGPIHAGPGWDPRSSSGWAVDAAGQLLHFGLDGAVLPVPPPPNVPDVDSVADALGVGRDGTVMATFYYRFVEPMQGTVVSPALFRLDNGAWSVARVLDGGYGELDVVRANRLIAYYRCWIYFYDDPNASSGWKQSVLDARCPTMRIHDLRALDLDDEGGIIAGNNRFVAIRDEAAGTWFDASHTLPVADYGVAAALGQGRVMIGSTDGKLYFRGGPYWCASDAAAGVEMVGAAALPEGGAAFLIPRTRDGLLRFQVP